MNKKQKRRFNFDDLEEVGFNNNPNTKTTTSEVLDIGEHLRSKQPQIGWGQNNPSDITEVILTSEEDQLSGVSLTSAQTGVKKPEVSLTSEVNLTPAKKGSEVKITSQDMVPPEHFFKEITMFVLNTSLKPREKMVLTSLLMFNKLLLSFSNSQLGEFLGIDRSNIGKIVNSLADEGFIDVTSEQRKKRVIDISPVFLKFFDYKEFYDATPQEFLDALSTSCEVNLTPDSLLVSYGFIYTKDTKNTKTNKLTSKVIRKVTAKDILNWQIILTVFNLFGYGMGKISDETFDFVSGIGYSDKERLNLLKAAVYTAAVYHPNNPYKYLVSSYKEGYYKSLSDEVLSQVDELLKLTEKNEATLRDFLLQGGIDRIKEVSALLKLKFSDMLTTSKIIAQKLTEAKNTYKVFEEKFNVEQMSRREQLALAQKSQF